MQTEDQPLYKEYKSAVAKKTLRIIKKAKLLVEENTVLRFQNEMLRMENERLRRDLDERRKRESRTFRKLPTNRGSTR